MPALESDTSTPRAEMYDPETGRKKSYDEFVEDIPDDEWPWSGRKRVQIIHNSRSQKARVADESFRAVREIMPYKLKDESLVREYYNHPNRVDVKGVDDVADEYKKRRVDKARAAFEAGELIAGVEVLERDEMDGAAGRYMSKEGVIKLHEEGWDPSGTLAHELGHALDHAYQQMPTIGSGKESQFGASAEIAAEEAGLEFEPPEMPQGDDPFHMAVHEASEERRGQIHEGDEYRTQLTEKFADWYAQAVETPRFTKAARGAAWSALEGKADQIAAARLEHMRERPRLQARQAVKAAIDEATTGVDLDWAHNDPRWGEADELRRRALEEVNERFESEYGAAMTQRIEERKAQLEHFRADRPEDFASTPATGIEEDDLYEGIEAERMVPRQTVEQFGELMGYEIGEIEVN